MSTWIYKDGEEKLCHHRYFDEHLADGWSVDKNPIPTKVEADTNQSGKLSSNEVRDAAKKAGIEGYSSKRIKSLKVELGYEDTSE